jgi:hypothetical protein
MGAVHIYFFHPVLRLAASSRLREGSFGADGKAYR